MHNERGEAKSPDQTPEDDVVNKAQMINREKIMESLQIPENSEKLVTIKSNKQSTGFLKTCYDTKYLPSQISQPEFDKVIERSSKLIACSYMKKRNSDVAHVSKGTYSMFVLCFLLTIAAFAVLVYGTKTKSMVIYIAGFSLAAAALIITLTISAINWFKRNQKFVNFEDDAYIELRRLFNSINEHYQKRGLFWSTMHGHYWIELHLKTNGSIPTASRYTEDFIKQSQDFDNASTSKVS